MDACKFSSGCPIEPYPLLPMGYGHCKRLPTTGISRVYYQTVEQVLACQWRVLSKAGTRPNRASKSEYDGYELQRLIITKPLYARLLERFNT